MRWNVISSVVTQLQVSVMSREPICAPTCFSSPPLIHSHRTMALYFDFAGSFIWMFLFNFIFLSSEHFEVENLLGGSPHQDIQQYKNRYMDKTR